MDLVIDSTAFCQDYHQTSTPFRLLFDGLTLIPAKLQIPEVVIDEVVNEYREAVEQAQTAAAGDLEKLSRLLGVPFPAPQHDPLGAALVYRRRLVDRITNAGGAILPYPEVPHKTVVERDLARRKPFKRDGSGYRDFLIWESLRKLVLHGSERIIFVTDNVRDFGQGPDLDEQLRSDILNPHRLHLFRSVRELVDSLVVPKLRMLEELKEALAAGGIGTFDLAAWLRANLITSLQEIDLGPVIAGVPEGVGSFRPTQTISLHDVTVEEARELESGGKLIRLRVRAEIEVSIDIDWDDYTNYSEVRSFVGENSERFQWSFWSEAQEMRIGIDLLLNESATHVQYADVTNVEGEGGSISYS